MLLLEKTDHLGGVWWFDDKQASTVYPNMLANTKPRELEFPGFPFDEVKGDYPTPAEYCLYLQNFASKTAFWTAFASMRWWRV